MPFYIPHPRVTLDCGDEEITKQSHKQECDINFIINQYQRTGLFTHINPQEPMYADLPEVMDYQESLNTIMRAEESFASLPSEVRDYFQNDPAAFLAAFGDPDQAEKLRELGLLKKLPTPETAAPPQINQDGATAPQAG